MMIQNSQMHQVVMNSLAVSALVSFGFGPSPATAQVWGGIDGCPPPSDLLGVWGLFVWFDPQRGSYLILFLPADTRCAFAAWRGGGGHGFPSPLHPLSQFCSLLGMATPGSGYGSGSREAPGHSHRGQGGVSSRGGMAQPEGHGTTPGGHSLLSSSLSISPVPPPPPPSATGTVGANVPPAPGNTFSLYLQQEVLH
uniref:DUF4587 domain-containing protein n=1 Tax=Meleagris gallopavo TaxID=9103 RepID=A0A803YJZ0_MELGA